MVKLLPTHKMSTCVSAYMVIVEMSLNCSYRNPENCVKSSELYLAQNRTEKLSAQKYLNVTTYNSKLLINTRIKKRHSFSCLYMVLHLR